jgi:hypothetical protein
MRIPSSIAENRETGKKPEPGHRWARDPSGKPSNPSIGKSDEPGFGFVAVVGVMRFRPEGQPRMQAAPDNTRQCPKLTLPVSPGRADARPHQSAAPVPDRDPREGFCRDWHFGWG